MAESEEIDLQAAFAKPRAKGRFRKLVGVNEISEEEVEEMVAGNDGSYFLECLKSAGQPVYEVSWGALWHGGSGKFELYYFDGQYFTKNDYTREVAGPFKKATEAAEASAGLFDMEYEPGCGFEQAFHYSSELFDSGKKLISSRTEDKIFATITGQSVVTGGFYWCEVQTGELFHDLWHDELGQAVKRVNEARKEGAFEAIATAEAALAKMEKKLHVGEVTLGEEAKYFTSSYDSFLMKVPLSARGFLRNYAADWVRLCFPRKVGKKTVVKVLPAKQIRMEVRQLIPVKTDAKGDVG
jgi:hypothetical protein